MLFNFAGIMQEIPLKNKIASGLDYKLSRMKEVIKTTRPHGHRQYYELIYLTQGAGQHQIDFQTFPITPPACFLVFPGQVHHWKLTQIPKGFVFIFRENFLTDTTVTSWLHNEQLQNHYRLQEDLSDIFRQMEAECQQGKAYGPAILNAYLQIVLAKLLQSGPAPVAEEAQPELVQAFRKQLSVHFRQLHQVQDYAQMLNVTTRYLNMRCKQATGQTASQLIFRRLTQEAKRELLYTEKSVAQIAFDLAFTDPSHFGKFFLRQMGLTPGQYRENIS